jgi:asparagine synthase (glutamine-hydrolysing)
MKKNLGYLKQFSPELYRFYNERVFTEDNRLYNIYKIKLFLFLKWRDRWIR